MLNKHSTNQVEIQRVAWLLPDMGTGGLSFQHLLCEFTKAFPHTIAFTGQWPGYAAGFENTFTVKVVGATQYIEFAKASNGYSIGFSAASPQIVSQLWEFKPQVIFANAFTAWTAIALLLKPICRWKVIVTYEGGSSVYESPSSKIRYQARRLMARLADAFVVNSQAGKSYLLDILDVKPDRVVARPFLVPSKQALLQYTEAEAPQLDSSLKRPIFLFVGQIIPRKGLKNLLEACSILKQQGYRDYTLALVGDGEQRPELETFVRESDLERQIVWMGKSPYRCLGAYFQFADVFVFPTYDDIWGMVLTEAMAFGKPVICSTGAGAAEMVEVAANGFVYAPDRVDLLVQYMTQFLDNPELIPAMGNKSTQIMLKNTPESATACFVEAMTVSQN
ncbi:glycosyltransferase family 4 protein [Chamaesiphon polymorphus]|uniref:Glycosyl transferase n=1 Tax=Chamaesiphon polymorphus CCALA 037 TaxID=2107692 RepID=A0A2T1GMV5_9CYAN|nr:glycosyltransferase family 4 protein [Chamaesiphon polymorphus]PSB59246.1 glycosyl transferase [Chamaesiphon polymorphus CCALA 037]